MSSFRIYLITKYNSANPIVQTKDELTVAIINITISLLLASKNISFEKIHFSKPTLKPILYLRRFNIGRGGHFGLFQSNVYNNSNTQYFISGRVISKNAKTYWFCTYTAFCVHWHSTASGSESFFLFRTYIDN
jgi:hypothetical protein